jgi:hypothetical protein
MEYLKNFLEEDELDVIDINNLIFAAATIVTNNE